MAAAGAGLCVVQVALQGMQSLVQQGLRIHVIGSQTLEVVCCTLRSAVILRGLLPFSTSVSGNLVIADHGNSLSFLACAKQAIINANPLVHCLH